MSLFSHKPRPEEMDRVLRDYRQPIAELVDAMIAGEPDVDLKLAAIVEGTPQQVRVAIVEKMREMLREQDEEKSKALDQFIEQQKLVEKQQRQKLNYHWLAYFMSQETLRKIRESFFAQPGLEAQVKNIGQELAKKGLLQNIQLTDRQNLGDISVTVPQQKRQTGRDHSNQR
jgi:ribosomal protein L1